MLRSLLRRALPARPSHRSYLGGVLPLVLALLGACAPDLSTAPPAAPGPPRRLVVPAPGYTQVKQVETGRYVTCALRPDQSIACWGRAADGGTTPPAGTDFVQIDFAGAGEHGCALRAGGAIACWGYNSQGQTQAPAGAGFTAVTASYDHSCALRADGSPLCWGSDYWGVVSRTPGDARFTQLAGGQRFECGLRADGSIACWGTNEFGELAPPAGTGFTQLSGSEGHACALRGDGSIACWGYAPSGRLDAPAGGGFRQVSVGDAHSCALAAGGAAVCWGSNRSGQAAPPPDVAFTQISAGTSHTCGLRAGGTIVCWGSNFYGESTPPTTRVLPAATFGAPASATVGQAFPLTLSDAQVPGYPAATAFTYAFDCGSGAYADAPASASATCTPAAAGPLTVRGKVIDQDGDAAEYSATVDVARAAQAVAFASTPPSPALVGGTYAASAAATSGLPVAISSLTPGVCTVTDGTVAFAAAGPCTVAADQAGSAAYDAAPQATQSVTVLRRPQAITLTAAPPAGAVVTSAFTLGATGGASGNPVVFAAQTPATCATSGANGTTLTLTAAGPCAVQATQAGDATYADAQPVTLAVTVLSAAQAVERLRAAVAGSGIAADVRQGLTDKLDAASASLARGQTNAACNQLGAFQNEVRAQRGKAVPPATADAWLAEAAQIRRAVGC